MMGTISFSTNSRALCRTSFSSSFSCESKSIKSTPEYMAMLRSFKKAAAVRPSHPARKNVPADSLFFGLVACLPQASLSRRGFFREIPRGAVPESDPNGLGTYR
jgi:hypothetical protein